AGEILLINCSDFLIKNLSIENADVGIEIVYGQSNKIENCKIYGNDDCGILIINSSYNEICKCKIKSKYGYGLHAINSFKNSIHDNEFIKNGIQLLYSNNNSITNNTIDGKYILQIGMRIDISKRNFIAYNNITGCWDTGIVIASRLSIDKNIIYGNNFYRNGVHAIWIADSFANMIVENNFIEHPVTASFENGWNVWLHNYWDGWRSPIPKPIYGYIEGFGGTPLFPLINFDWHPALKPFGGRK
ncbi:MAG: right-handed parallel beta-helix repeat-containing protein, partial [Thermoplasmata archaeon]|nr:right-handed parallel beta-helix repeat-containing protein [Thermoplasmata archaeon]